MRYKIPILPILLFSFNLQAENTIEKQLEEIGSVKKDEVVVVQRKFTRKILRHELTPLIVGGVPFGTIRNSLFGGASYTFHFNDWLGWEALSFIFTKSFFTSFTDDVNANKSGAQPDIKPDYQKLLFFLTSGVSLTPFYGKISTLSRWIAYIEPFFTMSFGLANTETNRYFAIAPGFGIKVFFREWFTFRAEFRDYLYTEAYTSSGVTATALRNNYALMASLSFMIPKLMH